MAEHHPDRAILSENDKQQVVPILGIAIAEGKFVAGCVLVGLVLQSFAGGGILFYPIVGGSLFVALTAVYASPSHVLTYRFLQDVADYLWRPSRLFAASSEAPRNMKNEGGLANYTPFEPDTTTQDLTNIKQAWTGAGAVLRSDNRLEAVVELQADNMDFAQAQEWASRQEIGQEFANKSLDGSLKFAGTTESFEIDDVVNRLEDRLNDPEIRESPTKRALLEEYRQRRPEEIEDRGTQTVRSFLIVTVKKKEVTDNYQGEPGPAEKLGRIPLLGRLFSPFTTTTRDLTEQELHGEMLDELDRRVHEEIMTEFVQKMPGFSARRLSTLEMFTLNARFWNGNKPVYDDLEDVVSNQAVKARQRRGQRGGGAE
ncbi:hypothetical protein [Halobacterium rubrum]|jgi:hypothetical protein|uniref:hypothetical protein n=1 Tax=Halobacterium TaxID=2239 RepID=UPI001F353F20|nr:MULTISPECIES: hypothetical protein [Halobacterium]MDH5021713.1 hypothetical protein [Halobacterium rubrum]